MTPDDPVTAAYEAMLARNAARGGGLAAFEDQPDDDPPLTVLPPAALPTGQQPDTTVDDLLRGMR